MDNNYTKDFSYKKFLFSCLLCLISVIAILIFVYTYNSFKVSDVASIPTKGKYYHIEKYYPNWFYVSKDSMLTKKVITNSDKIILYDLIPSKDSLYYSFKQDIDKLTYFSQKNKTYFHNLTILIISISVIGCMVRSLYDFIGHHCYLKDLSIAIWWPWYFLRPIIAVCISIIFIVPENCSLLNINSINTVRNLLFISFLAGFSLQDVISLLRKISKHIFKAYEKKDTSK